MQGVHVVVRGHFVELRRQANGAVTAVRAHERTSATADMPTFGAATCLHAAAGTVATRARTDGALLSLPRAVVRAVQAQSATAALLPLLRGAEALSCLTLGQLERVAAPVSYTHLTLPTKA